MLGKKEALLALCVVIIGFVWSKMPRPPERRKTEQLSYRLADMAATCSCNAAYGHPSAKTDWSEMAARLAEESDRAALTEELK